MATRIYDFTLGASIGAAQQIPVNGSVVTVLSSAPATSKVRITIETGESWDCYPGQGFRLPDGKQFAWVLVSNLAAVAMTGAIVIGDAGWIDNRITGMVTIADGGADKTAIGAQFSSSITRAAGGAGVFSMAGMRSTAATVANVKRLQVSSTIAGSISFYGCNGDPTVNPANGGNAGVNKIVRTGVASQAAPQRGDAAAAVPTTIELPGAYALITVYVAANTYTEVPLTTPWRLAYGVGFVAVSQVANRDVSVVIDFEESAT